MSIDMDSKGISDSAVVQKMLEQVQFSLKRPRKFYFHIQGGNHLTIARASADQLWKDIPEVISSDKIYHTVQCAETTTIQSGRCIDAGYMGNLKYELKKFINEVETHQTCLSFRYEARFGHLFFTHSDDQTKSNPVTTDHLIKGNIFRKNFVTRVVDRNIDAFKQKYCEVSMNPDEITYKITFVQNGESLVGGKFNGVCYVEEKAGSFTLLSVHNNKGHTNEVKIDIIRPGRMYDIRVASGVQNYNEEEIPKCVQDVAEKIAKSMTRFVPEEICLQTVGDSENYWVEYIREKKKRQYKWKKDPRWIFVEYDIRHREYTQDDSIKQSCPVPITFSQSDCRKEIELWSKVHSPPDLTQQWTTEEMLAADYFDEFVGSCFDIAEWLDAPVPSAD